MVKTPVTIIWKDPEHDWNFFWLNAIDGNSILLTGADDPAGWKHDGDQFWVHKSEIKSIKKGHHVCCP